MSVLKIEHGAQIKVKATSKTSSLMHYRAFAFVFTCTSPYLFFLVVFEVVRVIGLAASMEQACPQAICMYFFRFQ